MSKLNLAFLGEPVRQKGDQLFFHCPFHEDEGGHLGVHKGKGIYHCFKCNAAGKIQDLEKPLSSFKESVEKLLYGSPNIKAEAKLEEPLGLPPGYAPVTSDIGLPYKYLKKRMVTDEEIKQYKIGYCSEGIFAERIIIPIFNMDNKLRYFVGRSYTNRSPKYMNAPIAKKGTIFTTFAGRVKKAMICEGIFDALRIGKVFPAIALLGKQINGQEQLLSIVKATNEAYVVLDSDANKDGFITANLINTYIKAHVMFINKSKDPGSMSIKEIEEIIPK